jgi:hypothetical protein
VAVTVAETLRDLLARQGRALVSDPDRLAGLLHRALPGDAHAAGLIVLAAGAGIAAKVAALELPPPAGWELPLELELMVEQGVGEAEARYAVLAWAFALGGSGAEPVPPPVDDAWDGAMPVPIGRRTTAAETRPPRTALRRRAAAEPTTERDTDGVWIAQVIVLALAGAMFLYLAGFEFFRYGDPWSGLPALAIACVSIGLIGRVWRR